MLPVLFIALALAGAAGFFAYGRGPRSAPETVAVASASEVAYSTPKLVRVPMPSGADRRAQRAAYPGWQQGLGWPTSDQVVATPVFLVRTPTGEIRAFVARDTRNGCELQHRRGLSGAGPFFIDPCHGSSYDPLDGRVLEGPSPFDLNRLGVTVADDTVYVHPARIIAGTCRNPSACH